MDAFLTAFWPNVAATLLGVVVGVPLALWINAIGSRKQSTDKKQADDLLLRRALEVLLAGLAQNKGRFVELADTFEGNKVVYETALDRVVWDATREQITRCLANPELLRHIALHFGEVDALARLSNLYLEMGVGVGSALMGSKSVLDTLRPFLINKARALNADAESLEKEVGREISSLQIEA